MIVPGFSRLWAILGATAGASFAGLAVFAWTQVVTIPSVKNEVRTVVEAEAERRTVDAIKSVSDAAERARSMRRYCASSGLQYNFEANRCRQ